MAPEDLSLLRFRWRLFGEEKVTATSEKAPDGTEWVLFVVEAPGCVMGFSILEIEVLDNMIAALVEARAGLGLDEGSPISR